MDTVDPETRSRMMSGIRSSNTNPEKVVRKALHARGFRYRLNRRDLPGTPDIVFVRYRAVVFVHGCFWHGHNCAFFRVPKTRPEFWAKKISGNRARDYKNQMELARAGWRICIVWECALRGRARKERFPELVDAVEAWLRSEVEYAEFSGSERGAVDVRYTIPTPEIFAAENPE
jgi:DNA mismatch endonuclease, patch repair protein